MFSCRIADLNLWLEIVELVLQLLLPFLLALQPQHQQRVLQHHPLTLDQRPEISHFKLSRVQRPGNTWLSFPQYGDWKQFTSIITCSAWYRNQKIITSILCSTE